MDSSVRAFPVSCLMGEKLKALLQIGGLHEDNMETTVDQQELRVNWANVVALVIWLVSVVLLLHQAVRSRKARPPEGG